MQQEKLIFAVEKYCAVKTLCPSTKKLYRRAVAVYGEFLKREPLIGDLEDVQFSRWMESRCQQVARETLRGEAAKLLAVWRWAAMPKRASWGVLAPEIQSPESFYTVPRALTRKQLRTLFRYVSQMDDYIVLIPSNIYLLALLYLAWDTSERIGALLKFERGDLNGRWLTVYPGNRKGRIKYGRTYKLRRSTVRHLNRLLGYTNANKPFQLVKAATLYKRFRRIREAAGLPQWTTFHSIRRSHASHLHAAGGDARQSLGHSTDAVTIRSYLDPTLCQKGKAPSSLLFDPLGWLSWLR